MSGSPLPAALGLLACGAAALAFHLGGLSALPALRADAPVALRAGEGGELSWSRDASEQVGADLPGWRGMLLGRPLDLNAAGPDDLKALPGVGEKTSRLILEARERSGGFASVDDLGALPGLGAKRLDALRPWVRVSGPETRSGEVVK